VHLTPSLELVINAFPQKGLDRLGANDGDLTAEIQGQRNAGQSSERLLFRVRCALDNARSYL
jgi:hypothetical protein